MKSAVYRAASSYLTEAVQWHKRSGFVMDEVLESGIADAKRSPVRAIGAPRKAAEVKLEWLEALFARGADFQRG